MAPRRMPGKKQPIGDPAAILPIETNWRLWAALPASVKGIVAVTDVGARADSTSHLAIVPRPAFPRGVCRKCGCTWEDPCPGGCAWADGSETVCTECLTR